MKALGFAAMVICLLFIASCVLFNAPARVVIVAEPRFGVAPMTVSFDGSRSSDPDGICKYEWSFGAVGEMATHTFTAGEHTPSLTITDTLGDSTRAEIAVHVRPDPSGEWAGSLIANDGVTLPLKLDLDWDGTTLVGTVYVGVILPFIELPIVESDVDYGRIFIHAEDLVQLLGWTLCTIQLECIPGDTLTGDGCFGDQQYRWVVVRN